jgi:hypothetical protein
MMVMLSVSETSNSSAGGLLKMHLILPLHACHLPGVQMCFGSSNRATLRTGKIMISVRELITVAATYRIPHCNDNGLSGDR